MLQLSSGIPNFCLYCVLEFFSIFVHSYDLIFPEFG